MAEKRCERDLQTQVPSSRTQSSATSNDHHTIEEPTETFDGADLNAGQSPGTSEPGKQAEKQAEEEDNAIDPNAVDWEGPNDPNNPRNWSARYRALLVGVITCVVFSTSIASSAIAPAVPQILDEFHSTNEEIGTLVVTIELLGTAFGPVLMGPMSEVIGRRIIYNGANLAFSCFSLGCALTPTLAGLVVLRFLQGCAASCSINNAGGTISDLVPLERRGFAISMYSAGFLLGPAVGPIAGSYLSAAAGWRWIFWLLLIFNGTMGIICLFVYRETYAPVLLDWKAAKLRKETGNQALYAKGGRQIPVRAVLKRAVTRPIKMFLFCPVVTGLSIYNAVVYGFTYLLFSTFSVVFEGQYHYSNANLGLVYLGLAIGFLVSLSIASVINDRTHARLTKKHGEAKPEYRLESLIYGAVAIPIGFIIYGWTCQERVDSVVPIVATGIVGFGVMFTFIPFNVYMIDAYTKYAASAIAAGNILRSMTAALLPLAGVPLYDALGYGWGNSLLAFISLGLSVMFFVIRLYGEQWRKRFPVDFD